MSRLEVPVASGSLLDFYSAMWGPIYEAVLNILGSTGTIFPLGDPRHGQPDATTFTTIGEEQVTVTWSKAPSTFDNKLDLTDPDSFQGIMPIVHVDGVDEEADSPDATYFRAGDGSADNPLSIGAWVRADAIGNWLGILNKANSGSVREWEWFIRDNGKHWFSLYDDSAGVAITVSEDVALSANRWYFLCVTYDATEHPSGITLYNDGAVPAHTDEDDAGYVAAEGGASTIQLFHRFATPALFFDGKIAGGPLGPFFVQRELTADEVLRLYQLGRPAMGL